MKAGNWRKHKPLGELFPNAANLEPASHSPVATYIIELHRHTLDAMLQRVNRMITGQTNDRIGTFTPEFSLPQTRCE